MAEPDERQRKIARARAEQERRRRAMAASSPVEAEPQSASLWQKAGNIAAEVNTGILSLVPGAREFASQYGVGYAPGEDSGTAIGRGARYLGQALPMAAGGAGIASMATRGLSAPSNTLRNVVQSISQTAQRSPGAFYGAEAAGAMGAGSAGQIAEEGGAGPTGQLLAEAVGGFGAPAVMGALPRSIRAGREAVRANLTPFTEEGGMIRASRQMQERAGGPMGSAEAASRLDDIPEGVTPAQWIGDERLMAQEARLLADNPELERQVRNDLEDARLTAQQELTDMFGNPRSRQDWEQAVLEQVTPEGVSISRGQTDEMLNEAYKSFEPLYDQAKGHNIPVRNISSSMRQAVSEPDIIADPQMRSTVDNWLQNQIGAFKDLGGDQVSSDTLLNLRSRIRRERRLQTKRGQLERADLLGAAEAEITNTLQAGLPDDVVATLQQADSQYRRYKVVEDAIYNSGDSALTPEQLSQSIRMGGLSSPSEYARGQNPLTQEMRQLALSGRSTEEVLGDPRRAELFVRDLPDNAKRAVQADFMGTLFQRARAQSRDATEAGTSFVSGQQLMRDISENRAVMRSLGMNDTEIDRAKTIASRIQAMERRSPAAVNNLMEDGPASILQLGSALLGAKSGQRMAGGGLGSSMVMAQYMSNKARNTLARLTSDEAERLMEAAVIDPQLYRAMLTRENAPRQKLKESAQIVEAWLLISAAENAEDALNQEQQ